MKNKTHSEYTIDVVISIKNNGIVRAKAFVDTSKAANYSTRLFKRFKDEDVYLKIDVPVSKEIAKHFDMEGHEEFCQMDFKRNPEKVYAKLDALVQPVIRKMNELGIITHASCRGHHNRNAPGFVQYDNNEKINNLFKNAGFKVERSYRTKKGIDVMDATKYDKNYSKLWNGIQKDLSKLKTS